MYKTERVKRICEESGEGRKGKGLKAGGREREKDNNLGKKDGLK